MSRLITLIILVLLIVGFILLNLRLTDMEIQYRALDNQINQQLDRQVYMLEKIEENRTDINSIAIVVEAIMNGKVKIRSLDD